MLYVLGGYNAFFYIKNQKNPQVKSQNNNNKIQSSILLVFWPFVKMVRNSVQTMFVLGTPKSF